MNKCSHIYLLGLLLVYVLFSSKSCEEGPSAAEARKNKIFQEQLRNIENGMESYYLDRESILAYEEKAKQKTIEFADYLTLYSTHVLDSVLKSSLKSQIKSLLIDQRFEIEYSTDQGKRKLGIDDYLSELASTSYNQVIFTLDYIRLFMPLERKTEHLYMGSLGYLQSTSGITSNDTILLQQNRMLTEFYVKKVRKQFGSEVKYVWQVYLGDMNFKQNN